MEIEKRYIILVFVVLGIIVLSVGVFVYPISYSQVSGMSDDSRPGGLDSSTVGLFVSFEEGVSEEEIQQILGNYDLGTGYELEYNTDSSYYLLVWKDDRSPLKNEFAKVENWLESANDIEKGDYYIIGVWEPAIEDEEFLAILDEYNLQLKQSVECHVLFDDEIKYRDAKLLKNELEENDRIFFVGIDGIDG